MDLFILDLVLGAGLRIPKLKYLCPPSGLQNGSARRRMGGREWRCSSCTEVFWIRNPNGFVILDDTLPTIHVLSFMAGFRNLCYKGKKRPRDQIKIWGLLLYKPPPNLKRVLWTFHVGKFFKRKSDFFFLSHHCRSLPRQLACAVPWQIWMELEREQGLQPAIALPMEWKIVNRSMHQAFSFTVNRSIMDSSYWSLLPFV